MENLKIKVSSEAESKEVQELFFELGYGFEGNEIKEIQEFEYTGVFYLFAYGDDCDLTHSSDRELFNSKPHKEITIPELRDLVVLKRNSIDDATYQNNFYCYIELSDGWYYFDMEVRKWLKSISGKPEYYGKLKPIEKTEMKEYLVKSQDGKWRLETDLVGDPADTVIEVPCGADYMTMPNMYFWRDHRESWAYSNIHKKWNNNKGQTLDQYLGEGFANIVWQRNPETKQAEFLVKTDSGYVLQVLDENAGGADVVRIPDGATAYVNVFEFGQWEAGFYDFGKKQPLVFCDNEWTDFNMNYPTLQSLIDDGDVVLWKRETLNDQVASAEEYREMISNAAGIGLTSVVTDIAQSCSGGASRNASSQGQSGFPLNNYELNHRVAKAFNAVRGTDLNEDDVNYIRELINLTISHYGERK